MFLWTINFIFASAGFVIMIMATWQFHKLIKHARDASYNSTRTNFYAQYISLGMMYLFIGGFSYSIINLFMVPVDAYFTLVRAIFFLGAIFIITSTKAQIKMTMQLRDKNVEVLKTFVNAIDLKDSYTKGHSEHVYDLVKMLYGYLPEHCRERLNKTMLLDAAMLHDCGKISIKDEVLNKRGRLSKDDWESIKSHASTGKKLLDDTYFSDISDWVLYHHERMDGKGYYGLVGEEIPLESRIIAIADTYSALTTDRIYREHYTHEQAVEIMSMSTGSQLDAELMGCFMRIPLKHLEKIRPPEGLIYKAGLEQDENLADADKSPEGGAYDATHPGSAYLLH